MKTTEFVKAKKHEFHQEPCHGGKGAWHFKDYIDSVNKENAIIQFIHDDILPAGSAFGVHDHRISENQLFEEWYICLSGHGTMTLDGKPHPFSEGDVTVCRGGGSHGLENTGDTDMRVIVIKAWTKK